MLGVRRSGIAALALAAASAWAQDGLRPPDDTPWPRWQLRLDRLDRLAAPGIPRAAGLLDGAAPASGARVFGDVYLLDLGRGVAGYTGGLRATGGWTVGARGFATGMPPGVGGSGIGWRTRAGLDAGEAATASLPYVGFGLTGSSLRGGWGVSADIGLAGGGLRTSRPAADLNAVEEVLREWRLTPVLQLGVSYAF